MPEKSHHLYDENAKRWYQEIPVYKNGEPTDRIRQEYLDDSDPAISRAKSRSRLKAKSVELPSPEKIREIIANLDDDTAAQADLPVIEDC